jgi:hypothetical protein
MWGSNPQSQRWKALALTIVQAPQNRSSEYSSISPWSVLSGFTYTSSRTRNKTEINTARDAASFQPRKPGFQLLRVSCLWTSACKTSLITHEQRVLWTFWYSIWVNAEINSCELRKKFIAKIKIWQLALNNELFTSSLQFSKILGILIARVQAHRGKNILLQCIISKIIEVIHKMLIMKKR